MKKVILGILVLVIMLFVLAGCTNESTVDNSRFVKINSEEDFDILYDKKTKVEYAMSTGPYNYGTVTLLVDAEGKPLLYEGE